MKTTSTYIMYIDQYLAVKRSMGFEMKTAASVLYRFARLAEELGQTPGIKKDLMDLWCEKGPNETNSNRYYRVIYLRQFAKYLCDIGVASHMPKLPKFSSSFTPYIFSKEQISSFFTACDRFIPIQFNYNSAYLMMPPLFKLLYATGLRLGEALSLKERDVNLTHNYLIIRQSKNGLERIIPVSSSLAEVCTEYKKQRAVLVGKSATSDLFFIKKNKSGCDNHAAYSFFREILWRIGIAHQGKGYGPRIHDFRHTFACHSLRAMADAGLDIYHSLPILSNYLGHQNLESTNKYVRLTAEVYPDIMKLVNDTCSHIFPDIKIIYNETN